MSVTEKGQPSVEAATGAANGGLPLQAVNRPTQTVSEVSAISRKGKGAKTTVFLSVGFLAALAAASALGVSVERNRSVPPPLKVVAKPEGVVGLGRLLPASGVVDIAVPFGAADARVVDLRAEEGETLNAGEIIAVLDNELSLRRALEVAKMQVAVKQAAYAQALHSIRFNRREVSAQHSRALVAFERARSEYERLKAVQAEGGATRQNVDLQRAERDEAEEETNRLAALRDRYGRGAPSKHPDAVGALRDVQSARAEVKRAEAELEKAFVRAPFPGTVLKRHVLPGEKPSSNGVVRFGDIRSMKVEVEIYQNEVARVTLGARAKVRSTALSDDLFGVVSHIGLRVGRQGVIDSTPAANTDARVVEVTLSLDAPSSEKARNLSELEVTAEILTKDGAV